MIPSYGPRLYIVAGTRDEARAWARAEELPPSRWTLATSDAGRGLNRIRVAYVGTWRQRLDLDAIEEAFDIVRETGDVEIITEDRP